MHIEIICLFLKGYISINDFEKILYDNIDIFENEFDEDTFNELVSIDYN